MFNRHLKSHVWNQCLFLLSSQTNICSCLCSLSQLVTQSFRTNANKTGDILITFFPLIPHFQSISKPVGPIHCRSVLSPATPHQFQWTLRKSHPISSRSQKWAPGLCHPTLAPFIWPLTSCQWSFKNLLQISLLAYSEFSNGSTHILIKNQDPRTTGVTWSGAWAYLQFYLLSDCLLQPHGPPGCFSTLGILSPWAPCNHGSLCLEYSPVLCGLPLFLQVSD